MTPRIAARRSLVLLALAAAVAPALAQKTPAAAPASAADWPTKPVRMIVGFPPGSSPDLLARALAEPLSRELGQPVVVENKVGKGGNVASDMVAKATDDHTVGALINGNMTIAKLLDPKVTYDPVKDLQPVSLVGTAPLLLAAPATMQFRNAQEFFLAARNGGDGWKYGSPGVGTVGHLGMELLRTKTNMSPVHVSYPGNPQVIEALAKNEIQLALLPPGLAHAQIKSGKLKAVGVTSQNRSPLVPDYRSLQEQGILGFQLEIWTAVAAPKSMPKPIVERLSEAVARVTRTDDMRNKLHQHGWQAVGTNAEGLAARVRHDTATLGGVIMMRGIAVQ
ncbi:MAG TPA: tripartite tricarboxylate transporter substrate binding protein [Ramlibacter sp.]|nr:tripartite tricarboxylate transporter substrate binding protein [Ramlibacter sp.]